MWSLCDMNALVPLWYEIDAFHCECIAKPLVPLWYDEASAISHRDQGLISQSYQRGTKSYQTGIKWYLSDMKNSVPYQRGRKSIFIPERSQIHFHIREVASHVVDFFVTTSEATTPHKKTINFLLITYKRPMIFYRITYKMYSSFIAFLAPL